MVYVKKNKHNSKYIQHNKKRREHSFQTSFILYKILNKLIFCSLVAIGTCMQLLTSTIF